ncbi:MAG TPA: type II CAAX endopeptidase family protein [Gemmatimonadales bacterium]|nr:type II CAAX endopeptidase family protein [Gemmatimonadales bacterium]
MSEAPRAGRVSLAKAIGWSIAFVVLTLLVASMLGFGIAMLVRGSRDGALELLASVGPGAMLIQAAVTLLAAGAFTWLIGHRALGLTLHDLRWTGAGQGGRGFAWGLLAGALAAGLTLAISVAGGDAAWLRDDGTLGQYFGRAALTVAVLAPAALSEEIIFRGVPLVLLASTLGRGGAVAAIAIPFALAHLGNPNLTALGVGNIALAGIFLGLAFYAPGGIWTAWGAHLGWNGLLAALDTPVSGVPFDIPFLDYRAGAPTWLTGGAFGPEGGLAATAALAVAIPLAARWIGKDQT